jgi:hypothetical protein
VEARRRISVRLERQAGARHKRWSAARDFSRMDKMIENGDFLTEERGGDKTCIVRGIP